MSEHPCVPSIMIAILLILAAQAAILRALKPAAPTLESPLQAPGLPFAIPAGPETAALREFVLLFAFRETITSSSASNKNHIGELSCEILGEKRPENFGEILA